MKPLDNVRTNIVRSTKNYNQYFEFERKKKIDEWQVDKHGWQVDKHGRF